MTRLINQLMNDEAVYRTATVSDVEAGVWTKIMKKTIQSKIKMTRMSSTVLTLRKLLRAGVGTDTVEKFVRREAKGRKEERVKIVRKIMKEKVKDASEQEAKARKEFLKTQSYLQKRWGHNSNIMIKMKDVMQTEVRRTWQECKDNREKKVSFLRKKWMSSKPDLAGEKAWKGINYGDKYLTKKMKEAGELPDVPLVYGDAEVTKEQRAVLTLPSKFCTYQPVTEHNMKMAATVMAAKVTWELQARGRRIKDREGEGEIGGVGEWREKEEVQRQEKKDIIDITQGSINFTKRYVTDIPTCRRIKPPKPLPTDQTIILENMKSRIQEVTKDYLKNCDKKGLPMVKNTTKLEGVGIKEMREDEANVFLCTDKSGRLAAQRRDFYIEGMKPHMEGDRVITWEEQCLMERKMTATTLMWGKLLRMGDKWDSGTHSELDGVGPVHNRPSTD